MFVITFFLLTSLAPAIETIPSKILVKQEQRLFLSENLEGGKKLRLTDGSLWEIAPQDQVLSQVWIFPFLVSIEKSNNPNYPFYLVNEETHSRVLAKQI